MSGDKTTPEKMNDREITLDGDELEDVKENGGAIVIERYINGDLCTLEINLHC